MKKLFFKLLCYCFIFSLVGCGGQIVTDNTSDISQANRYIGEEISYVSVRQLTNQNYIEQMQKLVDNKDLYKDDVADTNSIDFTKSMENKLDKIEVEKSPN